MVVRIPRKAMFRHRPAFWPAYAIIFPGSPIASGRIPLVMNKMRSTANNTPAMMPAVPAVCGRGFIHHLQSFAPTYAVGRYPQHASAVPDFPLRRWGGIAQSSHFRLGTVPLGRRATLVSKGSDPFEVVLDREGEWSGG